jgi:hypothetical protein
LLPDLAGIGLVVALEDLLGRESVVSGVGEPVFDGLNDLVDGVELGALPLLGKLGLVQKEGLSDVLEGLGAWVQGYDCLLLALKNGVLFLQVLDCLLEL